MNYRLILTALLAWTLLSGVRAADSLFDDPVVAKARDFEIRESQLQAAYVAQKAALAAVGQRPADALEDQLKQQILDKLIATRVLLGKATPQDRDEGKRLADRMIQQNKEKAGSEGTYRRRLLALGSDPEEYKRDLLDQAIVQAVIDREIKNKAIISEADIRSFYDENKELYQVPATARVAHILFATRRIPTGEPLPLEERLSKKVAAQKAVERARAGEDFGKLAAELSDDPETKEKGGELTFERGGSVPPQFESAAFSLEPGGISEPVLTIFGYHVIKLLEKTPASRQPFEKVHDEIRARLQRDVVQSKLPDYVKQLRADAGVEILWKP